MPRLNPRPPGNERVASDQGVPVPATARGIRGPASRVSRQTVTTLVAAALVVVFGALSTLTPVPFVAWSPGRTVDVLGTTQDKAPVIKIQGVPTFPVTGQLRMTTVSVTTADSHLYLPQALLSYYLPHRDVLPRDTIYAPNKSSDQIKAEEVQMMDTSKRDAVVAALRAAGLPVTEYPSVLGIAKGLPADGKFQLGDFILTVNGTAVQTTDDITAMLAKAKPGQPASFVVLRQGKQVSISLTLARSSSGGARVGFSVGPGYDYGAVVTYGIDPNVVGPSAGLVFSLAIYDLVTEGDLLGGRIVAGTGEIRPDGTVGAIGAIHEKIKGAEKAGATIFLVPADNCVDLQGLSSSMTLVKVDTLKNAISALQLLKENPKAEVPHC